MNVRPLLTGIAMVTALVSSQNAYAETCGRLQNLPEYGTCTTKLRYKVKRRDGLFDVYYQNGTVKTKKYAEAQLDEAIIPEDQDDADIDNGIDVPE